MRQVLLALTAVIFEGLVCRDVLGRTVTLISLLCHLGAIAAVTVLFFPDLQAGSLKGVKARPVIALVFLNLTTLGWYSSYAWHYHYDQFITALTSLKLGSLAELDWFGAFPAPGEWICQFPVFFHLLQKPFFIIGPSAFLVKASTWMYCIGSTVLVYLTALRTTADEERAFLAGLCFLFFAPQLYISGVGLHSHAAVFFFLFAFYHYIALEQSGRAFNAVCLALGLAACYMGYPSSYTALPIMGLFMLRGMFRRRLRLRWPGEFRALLLTLVVLLPWIVYAAGINNFFLQRVIQVNAFTGDFVGEGERLYESSLSLLTVLLERLARGLHSLYSSNFVSTDFWFSSEPIFNEAALLLFGLGLFSGLGSALLKGDFRFGLIFFCLVLNTLLDVVLTGSGTNFLRSTITFPFIALFIENGLSAVRKAVHRIKGGFYGGRAAAFLCFTTYAVLSLLQARNAIVADVPWRGENLTELDMAACIAKEGAGAAILTLDGAGEDFLDKDLLFHLPDYASLRFITRAGLPAELEKSAQGAGKILVVQAGAGGPPALGGVSGKHLIKSVCADALHITAAEIARLP